MITQFDDICLELLVKGNAIYLATPREVADDINDTMKRAAYLIELSKRVLLDIRSCGTIEVDGRAVMDEIAIKADTALLEIRQHSK